MTTTVLEKPGCRQLVVASLVAGMILGSGSIERLAFGAEASVCCQDPMEPFVTEMLEHSRAFAPSQCAGISDEVLLQELRSIVKRASAYGFTFRGPLRTFIEMTFILGSQFDSDPQYPWALQILRSQDAQMARAERLYQNIRQFQTKVSSAAARKALTRWTLLGPRVVATSTEALTSTLRAEAIRIFPEKAEYVGSAGLTRLFAEAITQSRRLVLPTPEGETLMSALFIALGHGCTQDPWYAAIREALARSASASPEERLVRLREAAKSLITRELKDAWPL